VKIRQSLARNQNQKIKRLICTEGATSGTFWRVEAEEKASLAAIRMEQISVNISTFISSLVSRGFLSSSANWFGYVFMCSRLYKIIWFFGQCLV